MTGNALAAFSYGISGDRGEVFSYLSFRIAGAEAGIRRRTPRTEGG
jgi:hypothetical protein